MFKQVVMDSSYCGGWGGKATLDKTDMETGRYDVQFPDGTVEDCLVTVKHEVVPLSDHGHVYHADFYRAYLHAKVHGMETVTLLPQKKVKLKRK